MLCGLGLAASSCRRQFATPEFSGYDWGLIVSLPFGIGLSALLILLQMLWALLTQRLQILTASRAWAAPARSVLAGGIVWVLTTAACLPSARLKKQIGVLADLTGPDFKVAGFNSFLAARWYACFSLSPDDVAKLVREKGLTNTAVDNRLDNLRQASPFGKIANEAGVVPSWTAAQIWRRDSGEPSRDIQSTSWSWLAVDATGTNCFFTWG